MKVLVFSSLFPNNVWPDHGVFTKERMGRFASVSRWQVRVVAPVPYFPSLEIDSHWKRFSQVALRETIDGLEVYHPRYYMIPKIGMALHGMMMALSVLPEMRRIRETFDFDLIDAHFVYPDGFAAVLLGKILDKPVVLSALGSDVNRYKQFPIIRRLLRQTLRRAGSVIAVSQALKDAMVELGVHADRIVVIPNGVDSSKFFPVPKEEARAKLGLPRKTMLLSVGHLTPVKGFDLLIRAFKLVIDAGQETNLHLAIVGEGEARKELEKLVSSLNLDGHVKLIGAVPHRELYLWYNAADLFCLASSREGCPNVLLESLACGTPIVAVRVGGIPEIITADYLGIVTERNEHAFSKAITVALGKRWDPGMITRYARERSQDQVGRLLQRVFEGVLRGEQSEQQIF
jgi:glycosyltransferase involved in cell wall biosynthesis